MAGQPTGERQDGIPIADAAALLGLSAEAVRKRIQRGTLDGHKRAGHWFVVIERQDGPSGRQDAVRTERQDSSGQPPAGAPVEAAYRVTPAEIEQAVSRTSAQYMGDLRTMLAEVGQIYEGQLTAKDETIATQREVLATQTERVAEQQATIAELRRRAEVAEAELSRRREEEAGAAALLHRRIEQEHRNRAGMQAAQDGPGASGGAAPADPNPEPSAGFWARLRRVFGGGGGRV